MSETYINLSMSGIIFSNRILHTQTRITVFRENVSGCNRILFLGDTKTFEKSTF